MQDPTILLVSRSAADAESSRRCLLQIPHCQVVGICTSSRQVMSMVQLHHPDLVICDMEMGAADGLTLLRQLKSGRNCPLFLLTSYLSSDAILRGAQDCGADYFLIKPYTEDQLRSAVVLLLQRHTPQALPARSVSRRAHMLLMKAGFTSQSRGFHYLITGIELVHDDPHLLTSLTKQLYAQIAHIHNTSAGRVERDIRHTVRSTCLRTGMPPASNGTTLRLMMRALNDDPMHR